MEKYKFEWMIFYQKIIFLSIEKECLRYQGDYFNNVFKDISILIAR